MYFFFYRYSRIFGNLKKKCEHLHILNILRLIEKLVIKVATFSYWFYFLGLIPMASQQKWVRTNLTKECCINVHQKTHDAWRRLNVIVIQSNKFRNCKRKNVLGEHSHWCTTLTWDGATDHSVRNVQMEGVGFAEGNSTFSKRPYAPQY